MRFSKKPGAATPWILKKPTEQRRRTKVACNARNERCHAMCAASGVLIHDLSSPLPPFNFRDFYPSTFMHPSPPELSLSAASHLGAGGEREAEGEAEGEEEVAERQKSTAESRERTKDVLLGAEFTKRRSSSRKRTFLAFAWVN